MTIQKLQGLVDNSVPVIPVDYKEHTEAKPFCWNSGCSCHKDQDAISQVNQYVQDGLLTPEEATYLVNGKMV